MTWTTTKATTSRLVVATVASLALLSGCAGGASSNNAGGSGEGVCGGKEVTVGITKSASDAPLYIAKAKGYFEKQGLTVEFTPFDSAAKMIAPLGSGQLDVGAGAPSAGFYNAVANSLNLRIVADKGSMPKNYGYMQLLVRKSLVESGQVKSIADLRGRKLAEPAQATATSSTANVLLNSAGLGYNSVKHEYLGFSQHVSAFQNGAIDASLTTEPSATMAVQHGVAVRLAAPPQYYKNQQLAVLVYSGDFAEKTDTGNCFMTAYLRAARDYIKAFPNGKIADGKAADKIVEIVTRATGLEPELYRRIVPNYVHPNGHVNIKSLQRDYQFFERQGWLEGKVSVNDIVDTSFAKAAVRKLGKFQPRSP